MARKKNAKVDISLPTFEIVFENGFILSGELYPGLAPNTVGNFVSLANSGFYDGAAITMIAPCDIVLIDHPEKELPYCIKAECELNGCTYNVGHVGAGSLCFFHGTKYDSGKSGFFIMLNTDNRTVRMVEGAYALFGQLLKGLSLAEAFANTGRDEKGRPFFDHRIETIRVETYGREFPFETCPEPENTTGIVEKHYQDCSALSKETEI